MQKWPFVLYSIIVGILVSSIEKDISYFESILVNLVASNPDLNRIILGLVFKTIVFAPIIRKLYKSV